MADFNTAYDITMKNEGGYSNDPVDPGGETFKGISRNNFPKWEGWKLIDELKKSSLFPNNAKNDVKLNQLVRDFYKSNFWDVNKLDAFTSQYLANEMFDTGVNMGVEVAAKFLQVALNVLNKNGSVYPDITTDGKIGPNTLATLQKAIDYRGDSYIYKVMNIEQGNYYLSIMNNKSVNEKYALGWLERVDFIKR